MRSHLNYRVWPPHAFICCCHLFEIKPALQVFCASSSVQTQNQKSFLSREGAAFYQFQAFIYNAVHPGTWSGTGTGAESQSALNRTTPCQLLTKSDRKPRGGSSYTREYFTSSLNHPSFLLANFHPHQAQGWNQASLKSLDLCREIPNPTPRNTTSKSASSPRSYTTSRKFAYHQCYVEVPQGKKID